MVEPTHAINLEKSFFFKLIIGGKQAWGQHRPYFLSNLFFRNKKLTLIYQVVLKNSGI